MRVNKYLSIRIKARAYKNFKLKLNYNSIPKQKRYFYFYRRFNYFKPRLGRRRRRLSKFFFYRPLRRFPRKFSNRLRKKFILFLRKVRFSQTCAYTSFPRNFFHLFLRFYKIFLLRYRRNRRVYTRGHYFTLSNVFFKFIRNRLTSSNLRFKNKLLIYRYSFLMRRRFKLPVTNSIFRKALSLASRKQQSAFVIKLKKRRRLLKSLFKRLCFYDLKKVFFVTLRASKNNTMLSVFDFLGNLLY